MFSFHHPTVFKVCMGIAFIHDIWSGGWAGGWAASRNILLVTLVWGVGRQSSGMF